MGLIRKPSQIEEKGTISVLLYGQPGVGKSTLGMSAPDAVLLDYDGGVNRIHGAHRGLTVQVRSWEDTAEALKEIQGRDDIGTVVIDTAGKMLDYMSDYIMRTNTRMRKNDGTLSLQGYGIRKAMFVDFIRQASVMGRNIVFIAHEKEERRGDDTVKRPEIGGSSANDLIKELDLVGYVQMIGRERTVSFNPTEWFYAKNTCGLPETIKVQNLLDGNGGVVAENNFVKRIIATYAKSQSENNEKAARYEKLLEAVDTALAGVDDAQGLDAVLDSLEKGPQVFNSAMAGKMKVSRKAKELGLSADPLTGRYAG